MRTLARCLIVLVVLVTGNSTARGDEPAAENMDPPAIKVALIDMTRVFKGVKPFKREMAWLKNEVLEFEASTKATQQDLKMLNQELKKLPAGSEERARLSEQLIAGAARITTAVAVKKQQVLKRETELFVQNYHRIQRVVQKYAAAHGIGLIIRPHRTDFDETNRDDVKEMVNNPVIFQDGANVKDITDDIIKMLNTPNDDEA